MDGVGFFSLLVIGVLAGWIAERFTRSSHGLLTNMVLGIVGAYVGGFLARAANIAVAGFWQTLVAAVFGATILIVFYRIARGSRPSA